MNINEKVKVFAKVGLMKEPRWLKGILLEPHFPESGYLVEASGNKIWSEKVKRFEQLEWVDGVCSAVVEFENKYWDSLKYLISNAMKKFFPNESLVINENEKMISACDEIVTINSDIAEVESIAAFSELPVWSIYTWHSIPATRWEPQDLDCKLVGNGFNSMNAAKIFIDAVWSASTEGYWDQFT